MMIVGCMVERKRDGIVIKEESCRLRLGIRENFLERLDEGGVEEERKRSLAGMLTELMGDEEEAMRSIFGRVRGVVFSESESAYAELAKAIRGVVFEDMAQLCIPQEERPYPELERFILWGLRNPRLWRMDWEAGEEEGGLIEDYIKVRPTDEELLAKKNNDAICVKIVEGDDGSRVAVITGVIEAKNHKLSTKTRDAQQMADCPELLFEVVKRYQPHYPLIVRGLGLVGVIPERIDVVDPEKMDYIIFLPWDLRGEVIEEAYMSAQIRYVPITREEMVVLAEMIREEMIRGVFGRNTGLQDGDDDGVGLL